MMTEIKTVECRKNRTMTIELKCVCGKVLSIMVRSRNQLDVAAVAAASKWILEYDYPQDFGPNMDAYCPSCWKPVPLHHADA